MRYLLLTLTVAAGLAACGGHIRISAGGTALNGAYNEPMGMLRDGERTWAVSSNEWIVVACAEVALYAGTVIIVVGGAYYHIRTPKPQRFKDAESRIFQAASGVAISSIFVHALYKNVFGG